MKLGAGLFLTGVFGGWYVSWAWCVDWVQGRAFGAEDHPAIALFLGAVALTSIGASRLLRLLEHDCKRCDELEACNRRLSEALVEQPSEPKRLGAN